MLYVCLHSQMQKNFEPFCTRSFFCCRADTTRFCSLLGIGRREQAKPNKTYSLCMCTVEASLTHGISHAFPNHPS